MKPSSDLKRDTPVAEAPESRECVLTRWYMATVQQTITRDDIRPQLQNTNGGNGAHAIFYPLYFNPAGCQEFTHSLHHLRTFRILSGSS